MKKSLLVIPFSVLVHLFIINSVLYFMTPATYLAGSNVLYYNLAWLIITFSFNYYPTERRERFETNIARYLKLLCLFGLSNFALYGFKSNGVYTFEYRASVFLVICFFLTAYRSFFYWIRTKYRLYGGNFRNVVVVGRDRNLKKIRKVFDQPELGYRYKGFFDDRTSESPTYLGKMNDSFKYILENDIDYIYCIASKLSKKELEYLVTFADNNLKKLMIIPDNKEIFSRSMSIQLYDTIPVLAMRKSPLELDYAPLIKRIFDIVFSSLVILTVLSWLTPVLFVLMKFESKGPLFFKQKRNGVNRKAFWCYKFRSMTVNKEANTAMATKNDMRVTRMGKILRKTSIDELPQFINVFLGEMSVVGPRPHMESHTEKYETSIDKYLVRHFVKPGVTGLAQIKGYRGEIIKKADIVNRIRLDIFYTESWSLGLDLSIIFATVINAVRGEEKAY
ncbi:exopolysaccharide biosynthesis polyprenyl glycosylphosphotransferase [Zobellia laminariae]|uniref:exopolysaccharide biosynthesis polyprenyl glycosylphosphotransferase n=1 Tax=Zobellia laminariae TaxID=248906 RepID=UPI0012D9770A|nr:exopolysaccharide biosynthesis polyprenyl glycosylphosphotransferase [Zobellia laminariae]